MNNFSACSTTQDVMKFLERVSDGASEFHLAESARQQGIFNTTKQYVREMINDDGALLGMLQNNGEIHYTISNYDEWLHAGFWENLFKTTPVDDRATHVKYTESYAVNEARNIIIDTLIDMRTLKEYYNAVRRNNLDEEVLGEFQQTYYPVGYKMLFALLEAKLPKEIFKKHNALVSFEQDLTDVRRMLDALDVHKFDTVTIEEDMLKRIKSVQAISNTKSL